MASSDSASESSIDDFEEWTEPEIICAKSLFSDQTFPSAAAALRHDVDIHQFDLVMFVKSLGIKDFFTVVKLINWIRSEQLTAAELTTLSTARCEEVLAGDLYLRPVLENDALLQLDWDEMLEQDTAIQEPSQVEQLEAKVATLQDTIVDLKRLLYERMSSGSESTAKADASLTEGCTGRLTLEDKGLSREDASYFDGYADNEQGLFTLNCILEGRLIDFARIHEVMLQDHIRTQSYRNFILTPNVFKDKLVLDVGCGSGILSLFAAQAGAKHVYAVDASEIANKAKLNVLENGLQRTITVIQAKVEDVVLPVNKVDIIVSEWMGYACLFESMLDSVIIARDRFLNTDGLIAPSHCSLSLAGVERAEFIKTKIDYWSDVYGFKMNAMKDIHLDQAIIEHVSDTDFFTDAQILTHLNMYDLQSEDLVNVRCEFKLTAKRDGTLRCLCLWFDAIFSPPTSLHQSEGGPIVLSTAPGPFDRMTHWKQTLLFLKEPLQMQATQLVSGHLSLQKTKGEGKRSLNIEALLHHGSKDTAQRWQLR